MCVGAWKIEKFITFVAVCRVAPFTITQMANFLVPMKTSLTDEALEIGEFFAGVVVFHVYLLRAHG